ncbi:hypothetical protein F5148DRAFT_1182198, partial [Russula earlei]
MAASLPTPQIFFRVSLAIQPPNASWILASPVTARCGRISRHKRTKRAYGPGPRTMCNPSTSTCFRAALLWASSHLPGRVKVTHVSLSQDIGWNTLSDMFGSLPNGGGTFTAIDDTFPPATSTPSPNSFNPGSFDYLNTDFHPPWEMPTPPFSELDSVPSSASDASWAELTPEPSQPPPPVSRSQTDSWHRPPLLRST